MAATVTTIKSSASAATTGALVEDFLTDLTNANRSANTIRAYASDLAAFTRHHPGLIASVTPAVLRGFFAALTDLKPTTQARKQATVASFLDWAYHNDHIPGDPMGKLERIRLPDPPNRAAPRTVVERILAKIPTNNRRDRVLFRLLAETGLRVGEALAIEVEDLDLTLDDEHLSVLGKGGRRRTILLDDPRLVLELRRYLKHAGYRHGPLFRATKNGRGGPLRYQTAQEHWARYCEAAGVQLSLHQLRHGHATELVNDGVSLETIRKRLGHRHLQTTKRYADQSDQVADAELRARRRRTR